MSANRLPDTILFDLESYLRLKNWEKTKTKNSKLLVYESRNLELEGVKLLLPASLEYSDATTRIESVIKTLADIKGVSLPVFRHTIFSFNKDKILFRIFSEEGTESLPIPHAEEQISGMKKLIMYAASSEQIDRKYHERPTADASTLINKCEFGHTFRGSFGFSVFLRVSERNETIDFIDSPFPRRVSERLGFGVSNISSAVAENSTSPIVENYSTGLNSRMCDALVQISADGEYEYQLEIDWATSIPVEEELINLEPVRIDSRAVSLLASASTTLKHIEPHSASVKAYVSNLHCIKDPKDDSANRKIAMRFDHDTFGRIEVFVELGIEKYLAAVDAHKERKMISISGMLQRIGVTWSLINISSFKVVPADER